MILVFVLSYLRTQFNILMTIVFLVLCFVPFFLHWIFKWDIPVYMISLYYIFILLTTLGGTIYGLYEIIPFYDILLHTMSGVLLGGLGYYLFGIFSKDRSYNLTLMFLFIISFAILGGVVWEIWEFATDHFLGYNSQKYALANGELLVGHSAIIDTMTDLMCDLGGALAFAVITLVVKLKKRKKS